MSTWSSILRFSALCLAAVWIACVPPSAIANPPDGPRDRDRDREEGRNRDDNGPELSSEDRERIRKVLAEAWEDPEVAAARLKVHEAMEEYKTALEEAVEDIDPEAVALMQKMHKSSRQEAMREKMGPPRFGPPASNPQELVERIITNEPAFREMNEADKKRFMDLAMGIQRSGQLDEAMAKVFDAPGPREMGPARGEIRKQLIKAMKEADPWAKKAIDQAPEGPRWGRQGPPSEGERSPRPPMKNE